MDLIESGLSESIRDPAQDSSIILKGDGTVILTEFPVLEKVGSLRYDFKGFKNLKAEWKVATLGKVSSGVYDLRVIYGVRYPARARFLSWQYRARPGLGHDFRGQ